MWGIVKEKEETVTWEKDEWKSDGSKQEERELKIRKRNIVVVGRQIAMLAVVYQGEAAHVFPIAHHTCFWSLRLLGAAGAEGRRASTAD